MSKSNLGAVEKSLKQHPLSLGVLLQNSSISFPHFPPKFHIQSSYTKLHKLKLPSDHSLKPLYKGLPSALFPWGSMFVESVHMLSVSWDENPLNKRVILLCYTWESSLNKGLSLFITLLLFSFLSQRQKVGQERRENRVVKALLELNYGYDISPQYLNTDAPPTPTRKLAIWNSSITIMGKREDGQLRLWSP